MSSTHRGVSSTNDQVNSWSLCSLPISSESFSKRHFWYLGRSHENSLSSRWNDNTHKWEKTRRRYDVCDSFTYDARFSRRHLFHFCFRLLQRAVLSSLSLPTSVPECNFSVGGGNKASPPTGQDRLSPQIFLTSFWIVENLFSWVAARKQQWRPHRSQRKTSDERGWSLGVQVGIQTGQR